MWYIAPNPLLWADLEPEVIFVQTSLLGLAFGLILAFLAALIGPGLVDWNARKPWIEAEASRLFAMPVKLAGPVTLRLLPIPTLDLQDVTLGDGAQSITIGTLFGELRLAPLLRGQIIMERTAFSRPVLRLTLPLAKDAASILPISMISPLRMAPWFWWMPRAARPGLMA